MAVRRHLRTRFDGVKLRDLTALFIEKVLADMADEGVSASERQKAGAVLRKSLNQAVRIGLLRSSPMAGVKLPAPKRPEKLALTGEQVAALIASADSAGYGCLFRVWLDCGLRPSELFALEWKDFSETTGTLFIRRALDEVSRAVKEPKTKRSKRTCRSPGRPLRRSCSIAD